MELSKKYEKELVFLLGPLCDIDAVPMNAKQLVECATCCLQGLMFLHSHGFGHCDVRLPNIRAYSAITGKWILLDLETSRKFGNAITWSNSYLPPGKVKASISLDLYMLGKSLKELSEIARCISTFSDFVNKLLSVKFRSCKEALRCIPCV
jgi:hypothetical protein